jgi:lipopolysaccharide/colanic/teichoic acid biosynthesis glycosyltransferase
MKPFSRIRTVRKMILVAGDLFICYSSLVMALAWRQPDMLRTEVFAAFTPLFVAWIAGLYIIGLYDFRLVRNFVLLVGGILVAGVTTLVMSAAYFYALVPFLGLTPKTHLFVTFAVAHVLVFCWRRSALTLFKFSMLDLKLVMLTDGEHRLFVSETIPDHIGNWLALTDDIASDVDLFVVEEGWVQQNPRPAREAFASALGRGIPVVSLDDFYEAVYSKVSPMRSGDLAWALTHVLPRSGSLYFKVKRAFDLFGAALLIVLTSPILLLVALLIRCVDGMSPIYRQTRVGYLGKTFVVWKFQTMRPGSEEGGAFSAGQHNGASFATSLGSLLRRLRLDELPQLWNVLRGEMSLVGPRPEWIKEVEVLETVLPTYHLRHLVMPGMTGWAQVYFRATSDIHDSIEKHHYDLYYVKNFSLALDLSILLKTLKRVCVRDAGVTSQRYPERTEPGAVAPAVSVNITSVIGRTPR